MRYVSVARATSPSLASPERSPRAPPRPVCRPKQPYALARFGVPGWHSSVFRAPKSDRSFDRSKIGRSTGRRLLSKALEASIFFFFPFAFCGSAFGFAKEDSRVCVPPFSFFRASNDAGAPPSSGPTHPREQRGCESRGWRMRHRPQLRRAGRGPGREVERPRRRGFLAARRRPGFAGAAVGAERRDWPPVAPPEGAQRRVRQAVREGAGGSGDGSGGARAASAAAGGGARTRGRRDASGAPARDGRHGGGAPDGQPGRGHGGRGYAAYAAHDDRRGRLRVG